MRRRHEPKVVRQEVHWVPVSREINITTEPYRVWTLYGPGQDDPKVTPTLPIQPVHLHGSFLEDYVHDWNWRWTKDGGTLTYYSRVRQDSVWILLEFTE